MLRAISVVFAAILTLVFTLAIYALICVAGAVAVLFGMAILFHT